MHGIQIGLARIQERLPTAAFRMFVIPLCVLREDTWPKSLPYSSDYPKSTKKKKGVRASIYWREMCMLSAQLV